jgi:peptidoglycan hydrolase CwlO-like protein
VTKKESGPAANPESDSDRLQEIFDEDHLEFEDLLLDLQKKIDLILTQIRLLAQQISDSRTELLESREMIENLQSKTDRLHTIISEWQRERADADAPTERLS